MTPRPSCAWSSRTKRCVESAHPDTLFTSVLCLGEIRKGTNPLPLSRKRTQLEQWLDHGPNAWFESAKGTSRAAKRIRNFAKASGLGVAVLHVFTENNLLPATKAISNRWGELDALMQQKGRLLGNIDGLIAATALEHGLTVVTRNTGHFAHLGVILFDQARSIKPAKP